MKSKLLYNPYKSIKENAELNGVTESAIRKYIQRHGIDRKGDERLLRYNKVKELMAKLPGISIAEMSRRLNIHHATAKRYMQMSNTVEVETNKVSTFDTTKQKFIVRSVSDSQDEILGWILRLFVPSGHFDADLTYSKGIFYKRIPQPQHKFDKYPQSSDVKTLDEAYSLEDGCFDSIVIDLPFIVKQENSNWSAMMDERFTSFTTAEEMYATNVEMLNLAYRLLSHKGILVLKTMDFLFGGKQYWLSHFVLNQAFEIGFDLEDTFILAAKQRLLSNRHTQQKHARKYHSYFYVLIKNKKHCTINGNNALYN